MEVDPSPSSSSFEKIAVISIAPLKKYIGAVKQNFETKEEYVAFYHIPYARNPINRGWKRYQAPEPPEATNVISEYDASEIKFSPGVNVAREKKPFGSVDCLYLNIFLPKRPELIEGFAPVLVFFHGGGYSKGSSDPTVYTPDSIIQHQVIFITVSYRLSLHGFFNYHSPICPGNAGLKDQVRALEWIRDNIINFKGDPKNVTISGCGSGASCVNLHLVAPMSKGLFHKAIVQSGGVYCPWGYQGDGRKQKEMIEQDEECLELFLNEYDTDRLHERVWELLLADSMIRHPFSSAPIYGPTTETIAEGAFIPKKIDEMMQAEVEPEISILAGITQNEGLDLYTIDSHLEYESWITDMYRFLRFMVDNFHWTSNMVTTEYIIQLINRYCPINLNLMSSLERNWCLSKLVHDIYHRRFYDNFKFGPERKLHKNLFVYQFEYYSATSCVNVEKLNLILPEIATQGDELQYLYRDQRYRLALELDPEVELVTRNMCSLWANFCKTGVPKSDFAPDVEWKPHTEEKPCYLRIGANLHLEEGKSLCEDDWKWLNSFVDSNKPAET